MIRLTWIGAAAFLLLPTALAHGYAVTTHRAISQLAVSVSTLATSGGVLSDLGLRSFASIDQVFPNSKGDEKWIDGLIEDGAKFEDAILALPPDPSGRSLNHFFDPTTDEALCLSLVCATSPDWALEDDADFSSQRFSYRSAHRYEELALTAPDEDERRKNWGLMFETLGHVVHHLQDMAQPQHVRDQEHLFGSSYETYTAGNPLPINILDYPVVMPDAPAIPRRLWKSGAACEPVQETEFCGHVASGSVCWGTGIAEFTNYNFVTERHSFAGFLDLDENGRPVLGPVPHVCPASGYKKPNNENAFAEVMDWPIPFPPDFPDELMPIAGKLYFIRTPIRDAVSPEPGANVRAATYSIYDEDLRHFNKDIQCNVPGGRCQAIFTLNAFNFDDAGLQLLRRARAYSTGLLDYFFRVRIDIGPDPGQPGHSLITNRSAEPMTGKFRIFYDTPSGQRVATNLIFPTGTGGLEPGAVLPVSFSPASDLPPDAVSFTLVFKGSAGDEPGPSPTAADPGQIGSNSGVIAAKHVALGGPTLVNPAGRFAYDDQNGWRFTHDAGKQYGSMNWYGDEGVLSWARPSARGAEGLYRLPDVSELQPTLYEQGAPRYTAPGLVLGAGIMRVPSGATSQRYLVVITAVTRDAVPDDCVVGSSVVVGERAYRAALDQPTLVWEAGPQLDYDPRPPCTEIDVPFQLQVTANPAYYTFNGPGTEAKSVKGVPGLAGGVQVVTFTWSSGLALGAREHPSLLSNWESTLAVDYRGETPVTAVLHSDVESGAQWISVGTMELPVNAITPTMGRGVVHLDLRPPQPTVLYYDVEALSDFDVRLRPAWIVGGVSEVLGDWVSSDSIAWTDPTVASDPAGHAVVDWDTFHVSRLAPSHDVKSLSGIRGPVGLM